MSMVEPLTQPFQPMNAAATLIATNSILRVDVAPVYVVIEPLTLTPYRYACEEERACQMPCIAPLQRGGNGLQPSS